MVDGNRVFSMNPGYGYILKEARPWKGFEFFMKVVGKGFKGLCFTRESPSNLEKTLALGDMKIYWLTRLKSSMPTISPTNIEKISSICNDFVKQPGGIIFFDGVEYLLNNNNFRDILKLVTVLRDEVAEGGCNLIVSLNPDALDNDQLAYLERELETIE